VLLLIIEWLMGFLFLRSAAKLGVRKRRRSSANMRASITTDTDKVGRPVLRVADPSGNGNAFECSFYVRSPRKALEWLWAVYRSGVLAVSAVDLAVAIFACIWQAVQRGRGSAAPEPEPEAAASNSTNATAVGEPEPESEPLSNSTNATAVGEPEPESELPGNACASAADCGGSARAECLAVNSTTGRSFQCFCRAGWHGIACASASEWLNQTLMLNQTSAAPLPAAEPEAEAEPASASPEPHITLDASQAALTTVILGSALVIVVVLLLGKRNRARVHTFLTRWDRRCESQSAAMITAMLGSIEPAKAIEFAERSFRTVALTEVHVDDLEEARTEPAWRNGGTLAQCSRTAKFGEVDAFVSHAWRDVHDQRFDALQRWAAAFEAAQGKKPLLWLDKACLNWDDIESSLQCLPLFLSGCHQFVVLAGSVYTTRMWCCVEVFTFLRIGALVDRMSIWPLVEPGQTSSEARSAARDRFIAFDIADAQCYAADRDHLLEKIESGFDALERFNNICSQALIQRLT